MHHTAFRVSIPRFGSKLRSTALLVLFCLAVNVLHPSVAFAQERTIRVGYYAMKGFQEQKSDGTYSGYGYSYLLALAQYAGWDYDFVPVSYEQSVEMLQNGSLDLMFLQDDPEQYADQLACSSYSAGNREICLAAQDADTHYAYEDFGAFSSMRVGLVRADTSYNEAFSDLCSRNSCSPVLVWFDTQEQARTAWKSGAVDAVLTSSTENIHARILARFDPQPLYLAVNLQQTQLLEELNAAMLQVQTEMPSFENDLRSTYYNNATGSRAVFTTAEQNYLATKPVVRVGCSRSWYPLSYFDDADHYTGPLAQMYALLSEQTGIQFVFVPYDYYYQATAAFENGDVDMLCEMPFDFSFAQKHSADISEAFATISVMRVTSDSYHDSGQTKPRVAVLRSAYLSDLAYAFNGTAADYVPCVDANSCVQAVMDGSADYTYINSYQATYYQAHARYLSLDYVLMPEMEYKIAAAVSRNADPHLLQIINKSLDSIGQGKLNRLFRDAARTDASSGTDLETLIYDNPAVFGGILAAFTAVLVTMILSLIYNQRMKRKNAELQAATQVKSDFLARMSHDIRTPLNGIIGMTLLAQEEANPEPTQRYLDKISASGKYLQGLVNDILDMSRLSRGGIVLHPVPYTAKEFETYIDAVIGPLCAAKKQEFCLQRCPCESQTVLVDKLRYNQIFANLLSNASKYTPEGGRVALRLENTGVVNGLFGADYIVEDNGVGISPSFQKHMFEPFSQEKNSAAESGSGLGLSIVKELVEQMHGTIAVESEPGRGTRFTVHLELPVAGTPLPQSGLASAKKYSLKGRHILLCEDNALNREIAAKLLERAGAQVDTAENGADGVKQFCRSEPNGYAAILMDIRMPVMNGIEAARQIRALSRSDAKTVPIVAMTANVYEEDREHTRAAGMDAHLEKPIDPDSLYRTLYRLICSREKDS